MPEKRYILQRYHLSEALKKYRFCKPTPPLKNPVGPSSLMPQSEVNPPAHLHEIKIKENLNYTVLIYTIIQRISETENSGKPEQQNVETLNC